MWINTPKGAINLDRVARFVRVKRAIHFYAAERQGDLNVLLAELAYENEEAASEAYEILTAQVEAWDMTIE